MRSSDTAKASVGEDVASALDAPQRPMVLDVHEPTLRYYDNTWSDYERYWINNDNLALHFGYTDWRALSHHASLLNMNRELADRAKIHAGDRVLDAGCGVGGSSLWLAENRGADVTGITVVPSQLARARDYAKTRGLSEWVVFELADFTETPFPNASFDVLWAIESVCYATDAPAFYAEAARVLRPGGRLVIADGMRRGRPLRRRGEYLLRQWADGWAVPDIRTGEEHLADAAAAGFSSVSLDDVSWHVASSVARLFLTTVLHYPANFTRYHLGVRSAEAHGNTHSVFRLVQLLLGQHAFYGILVATK